MNSHLSNFVTLKFFIFQKTDDLVIFRLVKGKFHHIISVSYYHTCVACLRACQLINEVGQHCGSIIYHYKLLTVNRVFDEICNVEGMIQTW